MAKFQKLREWADEQFGSCAPKSDETLRRWARQGKIIPRPKKIGKEYAVRSDAVYVNNTTGPSLWRIASSGCYWAARRYLMRADQFNGRGRAVRLVRP
ncbi:hypothetical protein EIP75_02135 [Aquabacterium soli]|uniref:Excisionase-like domain-containing protein n=2 Tax=Aquabacterium soli TaxID=2493092 RepID=A0A426VIL3_9BURK|nr:hypothetical protein EIP75_02135 [Aquabacterium soli]